MPLSNKKNPIDNSSNDYRQGNQSANFFRNSSLALLDRGIDKLETFLPSEKVSTAMVMSPSYLQPFISKNYSHVFNARNTFIHHSQAIDADKNSCHTGQIGDTYQHHFVSQYHCLPFGANTLDLVFMPFMLNVFSKDQRQWLFSELSQCLAEDATLLFMGLNKQSLLGYQLLRHKSLGVNKSSNSNQINNEMPRQLISIKTIQQELAAYNLTLVGSRYFDYAPNIDKRYYTQRENNPCAINKQKKSACASWFDNAGDRWWPTMANGYVLMFKPVPDFVRLSRSTISNKQKNTSYNRKQVPSFCANKD